MGTFAQGDFYEVEARVEGGQRYFDNGTCRVGTMSWSMPFVADAFVGKHSVTVGLALLGNAATVESVRSQTPGRCCLHSGASARVCSPGPCTGICTLSLVCAWLAGVAPLLSRWRGFFLSHGPCSLVEGVAT
jgi:hypothetical protein